MLIDPMGDPGDASPRTLPQTQKGEAGLPLLFYIPAYCVSFGAIRAPATAGFNPGESATELVQPEIHFYADLYGHGLAILHGRFELPLANRFKCLLIQPHAKFASHTNLLRNAVRADNHP